jgi:hypothetical protein
MALPSVVSLMDFYYQDFIQLKISYEDLAYTLEYQNLILGKPLRV